MSIVCIVPQLDQCWQSIRKGLQYPGLRMPDYLDSLGKVREQLVVLSDQQRKQLQDIQLVDYSVYRKILHKIRTNQSMITENKPNSVQLWD